jgi:uncharacterized caspase-like protein
MMTYDRVEIYQNGALLNEQASLTNIRDGLRWLQQKARPGQVDTVIVFLSGHGVSDAQGRYFFPAHEFDLKNIKSTSLPGEELQQALGGQIRAKNVFLFVDSCHSGALSGARNDDLNFQVKTTGIYMIAS